MTKRKDDEPIDQPEVTGLVSIDLNREEFRAYVGLMLAESGFSLDKISANFAQDAQTMETRFLDQFVAEENREPTIERLTELAQAPDYRFPIIAPTRRNVATRHVYEMLATPHNNLALQHSESPDRWVGFAIYDDFAYGMDVVLSRLHRAEQVQVDDARALLRASVQGTSFVPSAQPTPLNEAAAEALRRDQEAREVVDLLDDEGFRLLDASLTRMQVPESHGTIIPDYRRHDVVVAGAELAVKAYKAVYPLTEGIAGLANDATRTVQMLFPSTDSPAL